MSMPGFKLNHVSKRGPRYPVLVIPFCQTYGSEYYMVTYIDDNDNLNKILETSYISIWAWYPTREIDISEILCRRQIN